MRQPEKIGAATAQIGGTRRKSGEPTKCQIPRAIPPRMHASHHPSSLDKTAAPPPAQGPAEPIFSTAAAEPPAAGCEPETPPAAPESASTGAKQETSPARP